MISSLHGAVAHVGLDRLVVEVGGVGLLVHTTPATAADARTGASLMLSTSLVVREDSLTLFGFRDAGERDMFEQVQTVTGVGPRLALAMLSVMGPSELATALVRGDTRTLTKIPGVGPKSAQRLVLELRDKVAIPASGAAASGAGGAAASVPMTSDGQRDQVIEALVGLGWSAKAAGDAVVSVATADPGAGVATLLRLALRELGR